MSYNILATEKCGSTVNSRDGLPVTNLMALKTHVNLCHRKDSDSSWINMCSIFVKLVVSVKSDLDDLKNRFSLETKLWSKLYFYFNSFK